MTTKYSLLKLARADILADVKFILTYSGSLPSKGDPRDKHQIRTCIHPQLKELWRVHPALIDKTVWIQRAQGGKARDGEGLLLSSVGEKDFAVLVHPNLSVHCELDILVLKREAPNSAASPFRDIDNQLKTLFDALRRPLDANEIPKSWKPSEDEMPLFCLLEDDKLITRVNVDTDRLLTPGKRESDVTLMIQVQIKGFVATWRNIGLVG